MAVTGVAVAVAIIDDGNDDTTGATRGVTHGLDLGVGRNDVT